MATNKHKEVPESAAPDRIPPPLRIGDRLHFMPLKGDGPHHAILIGWDDGVLTLQVTKPSGATLTTTAVEGDEPGNFRRVFDII